MGKFSHAQAAIESSHCSTARTLHAQAATEQMILFGVVLLVMLVVLALIVVWPNFTYSVEKQRSDSYWLSARPFSIKQQTMVPDQMVLELQNTEPVSLTLRNVWLDGVRMDYYNYSVPFDWSTESPHCAGSSCNMTIRPGQTQIISTGNFTSSPSNPCVGDSGFSPGTKYKMGLALEYYGSNESEIYNQTGSVKLVGECGPG